MFYQLRFLSPTASDAEIATHAGFLVGAKTAAKVCTGLFWGRLADSSLGGRKMVLLIGLSSSCESTFSICLRFCSRSYRSCQHWLWALDDICRSNLVADICRSDEQ